MKKNKQTLTEYSGSSFDVQMDVGHSNGLSMGTSSIEWNDNPVLGISSYGGEISWKQGIVFIYIKRNTGMIKYFIYYSSFNSKCIRLINIYVGERNINDLMFALKSC